MNLCYVPFSFTISTPMSVGPVPILRLWLSPYLCLVHTRRQRVDNASTLPLPRLSRGASSSSELPRRTSKTMKYRRRNETICHRFESFVSQRCAQRHAFLLTRENLQESRRQRTTAWAPSHRIKENTHCRIMSE